MADVEASVTYASGADGSGYASREALALIGCLEELRYPGDGVGALDSGAGQKVVQWCPCGSCVGPESPVEVHHAKKPTKLAGSL
jgi:hypothetical protein